jgi:hypothetical protein
MQQYGDSTVRTWQMVGGQGVNGSWAADTYETITSMSSLGGELFVGLGNGANEAEVWQWNGTTWTQIGGDSINTVAGQQIYEEVSSMATHNGNLIVGLGNGANDAEVWSYGMALVWSKLGGDS